MGSNPTPSAKSGDGLRARLLAHRTGLPLRAKLAARIGSRPLSRDGIRVVAPLLVRLLVAGGLAVLVASPLRAQKTDLILLQNGDRVTGEILKLQRGRLVIDTAQAGGKVNIRWRYIADLESDKLFEIRLGGGELLIGGFRPAPGDSLVQITLADGSTRFVPETIDLTVWRALGTRGGGEVVGEY